MPLQPHTWCLTLHSTSRQDPVCCAGREQGEGVSALHAGDERSAVGVVFVACRVDRSIGGLLQDPQTWNARGTCGWINS